MLLHILYSDSLNHLKPFTTSFGVRIVLGGPPSLLLQNDLGERINANTGRIFSDIKYIHPSLYRAFTMPLPALNRSPHCAVG